MAVLYLRSYNLPRERRERLEYRGWLKWLNYLVRLRWRQGNRYCMGLSMYARKRKWERRGVFHLIRLIRQREAGRFNILIDPGSPCYTLTFTTITLRQSKTLLVLRKDGDVFSEAGGGGGGKTPIIKPGVSKQTGVIKSTHRQRLWFWFA